MISRALGVGVAIIMALGSPSSADLRPVVPASDRALWPSGLPAVAAVTCPHATREVSTAEGLKEALAAATPGEVIHLARGTYSGSFTVSRSGSAGSPVWLCGSRGAVLSGRNTSSGTVLHLQDVHDARLVGFTVQRGKKGVMVDGSRGVVLQGLSVHDIGDEGVHLRSGSKGNLVRDLRIQRTGLRKAQFGEGVYVGSAHHNWCRFSACAPDRSDGNAVVGNVISRTTAEAVDVKEGTSGGLVYGNSFDGSGMSGDADSWVDVKGDGWLVQRNTGRRSTSSGFQVHQLVAGWGLDNTFDANTAHVGAGGYGFEVPRGSRTRVTCTNEVSGAREGYSTETCS